MRTDMLLVYEGSVADGLLNATSHGTTMLSNFNVPIEHIDGWVTYERSEHFTITPNPTAVGLKADGDRRWAILELWLRGGRVQSVASPLDGTDDGWEVINGIEEALYKALRRPTTTSEEGTE